jgi:hypothetical protein
MMSGDQLRIVEASCKLCDIPGSIKMFFSVIIAGVTIHRCRLIDTNDGREPWVSPPVETWLTRSGDQRYRRLCEFPQEMKSALDRMATDTYRRLTGTI